MQNIFGGLLYFETLTRQGLNTTIHRVVQLPWTSPRPSVTFPANLQARLASLGGESCSVARHLRGAILFSLCVAFLRCSVLKTCSFFHCILRSAFLCIAAMQSTCWLCVGNQWHVFLELLTKKLTKKSWQVQKQLGNKTGNEADWLRRSCAWRWPSPSPSATWKMSSADMNEVKKIFSQNPVS